MCTYLMRSTYFGSLEFTKRNRNETNSETKRNEKYIIFLISFVSLVSFRFCYVSFRSVPVSFPFRFREFCGTFFHLLCLTGSASFFLLIFLTFFCPDDCIGLL